jgi:hypothetical protein
MTTIHIFESDANVSKSNAAKSKAVKQAKTSVSSNNEKSKPQTNIMIEYDGFCFGFTHDKWGIGYWYNISTRPDRKYGYCKGIQVPMMYWGELTQAAIDAGHIIDYGHNVADSNDSVASDSKPKSKSKSAGVESFKIFD